VFFSELFGLWPSHEVSSQGGNSIRAICAFRESPQMAIAPYTGGGLAPFLTIGSSATGSPPANKDASASADGVTRMGKAARRKQERFAEAPSNPVPLAAVEHRARRLAMAGDTDGAISLYADAVSRGSNSPEVFNDLGTLLARRRQFPAAVVQFEIALALVPGSIEVRKNLSMATEAMSLAAFRERRWEDAAAGYGRLTAIDPTCALFQTNVGVALRELRRHADALPYFRRAADLDPENSTAHFNLGSLLFELNQREAESELERAISLDPSNVAAHVGLAGVHNKLGQLQRSAATVRHALELSPDQGEAHANLASVLREQGDVASCVEHYRRALQIRPNSPVIFSNYLFARQADPTAGPSDLLADHLAWAARLAAPLDPGPGGSFAAPDRDPNRCLRVGYVSADLRNHSVAAFIEPIIAAHDRSAVQVYCYSDTIPDMATLRIRTKARPDFWLDVRTFTDEALAKRIVEDRIDVLVDLGGHTAGNRLLTFARRPAPVQVTYCGYPGTTGLAAMNWRLTDAIADPQSVTDRYHVESLWRLPNGFLCFRPNPDFGLPGPSPAMKRGYVTFGSFNNLSKIGDSVIELWARILASVPTSRLFLKARGLSDEEPRERLRAAFSKQGIDAGRIEFATYAATTVEHSAVYGQIDIALDPFPYNGATTTCEALWMGVPVVTLMGRTHAGRVGASLLSRIGCEDLVATSPETYVQTAVNLAHDVPRLNSLHRDLRERIAGSALTNASLITRDIETAYREMWHRWCSAPPASSG
jgi:protein O-GlcNAc transferase